jgi:Domain of unknown function (DUF4136)
MKHKTYIALSMIAGLLLTAGSVWASTKTDYDHNTDFGRYKTYSWAKIQTANSLWDERVKSAVNSELAAKGWREVPSGGDVAVTALKATHDQQQLYSYYNGFGGRRWGGFNFGDETTTVSTYEIGTLAIDMYDANTKQLIWHGATSDTLSDNANKNVKKLDSEVHKLFKHFPPEEKEPKKN